MGELVRWSKLNQFTQPNKSSQFFPRNLKFYTYNQLFYLAESTRNIYTLD